MDIPDTVQNFQDPMFPLGGGAFSQFQTMGSYAVRGLGAKHVSFIAADIPTAREFTAEMRKGVIAGGGTVDHTVYYSLTAADDTPVVQKAIAGYHGNGYIVMSGDLGVGAIRPASR